MLSRRGFLAAGLTLALHRRAFAIGQGSKFRFGQLQLGPGNTWNPRPTALRRLGWEIEKRTSIDVELDPMIVHPTSENLHSTPFLYLAGQREIELPSTQGIEALHSSSSPMAVTVKRWISSRKASGKSGSVLGGVMNSSSASE